MIKTIQNLDLRDKQISEVLEYDHCLFKGNVLLQFCRVEQRLKFKKCKFENDIIFGKKSQSFGSYIGQELYFEDCEFIGQVYLDGIRCDGNIMFSNCLFRHESQFENDYALSIGSADIANTVIIKDSAMLGGISLADTTIHLVGFILENVKIIAPKCNLYFSTCHLNKEFLIKACTISVKRLFMEKMNMNSENGNIKLTGTRLNRIIKSNQEESVEDFAKSKFAHPKLNLDTNFEYVRTVGNYTTIKTADKNLYSLVNVGENLFFLYKSNYIEAEEVITFRSSTLGNSFEIIGSELHSKYICLSESTCGTMIYENSYFQLKRFDLNSLNVNGTFCSENNQYGIEVPDVELKLQNSEIVNENNGVVMHSASIGNNLNLINTHFNLIDGNGTVQYDMSNIQIGGVLSISDICGNCHVVFNLENSKCDEFCYSQTGTSNIRLKLEGSQFDNIRMEKTMPNFEFVSGLLSSKDIKVLPKKKIETYQKKQKTTIESGTINFLRNCQDQLINKQDDFEEANKIWRLRNKIRLLRKNQYKKNLSYWANISWNELTDYGLSSFRLALAVVLVFLGYCLLNSYVLDSYTQYNVADNTMNVVGQSLIQYVPTIDFGDEVKIIEFEEGLPSMYKYIVIFARIVGFILISVLVGSLGGLWTGRNK